MLSVVSCRLSVVGFIAFAFAVVPSAEAATTKYWITRAVTCHSWTETGSQASLNTNKDALKARGDGWTVGYCDVKLPDDATIRWGRAYGADGNALQAISFALRKALYCSEDYSDIATWTSTDNGEDPSCTTAGWTNANQLNDAVSNSTYTYWFYFSIPYSLDPDNLRLWNLEIEYQVP